MKYLIPLTAWILLLGACQKGPLPQKNTEGKNTQPSAKFETVQKGVHLSLLEYFPVADLSVVPTSISFADPVQQLFLPSGWGELVRSNQGEIDACWTEGRCAVVDIPRAASGALSISLNLSPPPPRQGAPEQIVRLLWNQRIISEHTLASGPQKILIEIPSEQQNPGPNRLMIEPRYWYCPPELDNATKGFKKRGVLCSNIDILPEGQEIAGAPQAATIEEGKIIQFPGSVISYYFTLPESPTLSGSGRFVLPNASLPSGLEGQAVLSLVSDESPTRILLCRNLVAGSSGEFAFQEDLSDYAGKQVCISLCFSFRSEGGAKDWREFPVTLEWKDPKIDGLRHDLFTGPSAEVRTKYNVIILVFDALRAGFLPAYGNTEVSAPETTRLAANGTVFLKATSNASYTTASTASLFSSCYPQFGGKVLKDSERLPDAIPNLAECLKKAGYKTLAFTQNPNISPTFGFNRGFDLMKERYGGIAGTRDRDRLLEDWDEQVMPMLEEASGEPFFLYAHIIKPHSPYAPIPPFDTMYDHDYQGRVDGSPWVLDSINKGIMKPEIDDLRHIEALYKGEISRTDRFLGKMLDWLEKTGLEKNTLMVFISDHGEEFYENGFMNHGMTLSEELLRVPSIWKLPGILPSGKASRFPLQTIDIAPTILDLVGAEVPGAMQGKRLFSYFFAPDSYTEDRYDFAYRWDDLRSVQFRDLKLIQEARPVDNNGQVWWDSSLYDLESDPTEDHNMASSLIVATNTLRQAIEWQALCNSRIKVEPSQPQDIKQTAPDIVKDLQGLGYLGNKTNQGAK